MNTSGQAAVKPRAGVSENAGFVQTALAMSKHPLCRAEKRQFSLRTRSVLEDLVVWFFFSFPSRTYLGIIGKCDKRRQKLINVAFTWLGLQMCLHFSLLDFCIFLLKPYVILSATCSNLFGNTRLLMCLLTGF